MPRPPRFDDEDEHEHEDELGCGCQPALCVVEGLPLWCGGARLCRLPLSGGQGRWNRAQNTSNDG
jgi:hypothetical protein